MKECKGSRLLLTMRRKGKEGYTGSRNDDTWKLFWTKDGGWKDDSKVGNEKRDKSEKTEEYRIKAEVRREKVVLGKDKGERGRRGIGSI